MSPAPFPAAHAEEIIEFWFARPGDPEFETGRKVWFEPRRAFDEDIRRRFEATHGAAAAGALDGWMAASRTCLALVLALDQFPRNMYRFHPRSYATDAKAIAVARHAVAQGFDASLRAIERTFVYLPFEHSENLDDQRRGVALVRGLAAHPRGADWLGFAERHMRIVERFGRFPHRNAILGRASTAEETAFLTEPHSTFLREPKE
jgi:uncharacterized protein (DUF924 family)